jgi:hypothetical protein
VVCPCQRAVLRRGQRMCGHPVPSSRDSRDQAQLDLHAASAIANWRSRH